jgi:hypothetical protein
MQVAKPAGTREQTAVADFFNHCALVRPRLEIIGPAVPSLLTCFDLWAGATARFGECELYARSLDRCIALDVFEERRPELTHLVEDRNEAGIELLGRLRETLPEFGRELSALEVDRRRVAEVLQQTERDFRERLAEWEMKGSDAEKLMDRFLRLEDVVVSHGLPALSEHLDKAFAELADGRRRPDRGTYDNIPWWKAVLAGGMFGWYVASIIFAFIYRPVNADAVALWLGITVIELIHIVLFVGFC